MLRTLRAFLWMRWRTGRNAFRGQRSNDSFEKISRALTALAPIFMIVMLIPTMLAALAVAAIAGYQLVANPSSRWIHSLTIGRFILGAMSVMLLVAPMIRSGRGTGSEMTRLMLLPIRRAQLHLGEVAGGLGDPWLAVLVPALIAFGGGMAAAGNVVAGVSTVLGALLFVVIMALAMSLGSFVIALVFRNRQRAEWFTIILITVLSISGLAVAQLDSIDLSSRGPSDARSLSSLVTNTPHAIEALPSELYISVARNSLDGETMVTAIQLIAMLLWVALLYLASRWTHSRLLETPESGGGGHRSAGLVRLPRPIPGVSAPVAAIAWAQVRLALRSVRGKTGVFLNFVMVGLIYLVLVPKMNLELPPHVSMGMGVAVAGSLFTMLSLQPIIINAFAVDGAGLTLQFLSPLTPRQIANGKFIAGAMLFTLSATLCFVAGLVLAPSGSPLLWIATLIIIIAGYLLFAPVAILLSILLPKVCDLSKMGKDGNPQPIASLAATFATPLSFAPSALIAVFAIYGESPSWVSLLLAALWLGVVSIITLVSMRAIPKLLLRRQENLLLVAGGR
jgi:hypothetical protein